MNSNHDHDFHNTSDVSSLDEDDHNEKIYYDVDDRNADDDTTDEYNVLMDSDNSSSEKSYVILKQDELDKRQQEEIEKVTSVLSVSNDDACMLLLKYNWSAINVNEAWFEDEVKVRDSVGLLDVDRGVKFPKNDKSEADCGICFDSVMVKDFANSGCGHVFCKVCWEGYVSTAILDGPGCLTIKCPEPSCDAAVCPDMVKVLAKGEGKKNYDMFWLRSYVESNKNIKWCPGPGCDCAIEFDDDSYDGDNYDVTFDCKYVFCWKCMEDDAHSPLNCETVGKWALKNTDEAQNTNCWILLHTKPCPKCNRPIEKNNGCMDTTWYERAWWDIVTQLQFITDAWLQIVECRHGRAEARLERLHFWAETRLWTYVTNYHREESLENFSSFRAKLANLTRVTRSYFEKLVRALENGLSEVDSHEVVSKTNLSSVQGDTAGSSTKQVPLLVSNGTKCGVQRSMSTTLDSWSARVHLSPLFLFLVILVNDQAEALGVYLIVMKRWLVPKSVGVSGRPLPVEHNVVAQGCGVLAIPFDASSVRPTVLTPCVREEVRVQLDGSSGGRRFNELKHNVADHDGGQANQPSAALGVSPITPSVGHLDCVSPIGPSVGRSKRNASSQDDGDNVFHIGPSVPLKRPCVRQLSSLLERVVLNTHLTSQSANPVNVNTSSVPTDEHHDDAHHGVHIGAARIPVPDRGFRHPVASLGSCQVPTVNADESQQQSRRSPTVNTGTSRQQPHASGPPPDYKYLGGCTYSCHHCGALFWSKERLKSVPKSSRPHVQFDIASKGEPPRFLQLYIYDTDNEVDNRMSHFGGDNSDLRRDIVEGLVDLLDTHNGLVQLFRTAREKFQDTHVPNFKVRLYNVVGAQEYELPTGDMLGAIVYETGPEADMDYDIVLEERSGYPQRVNKLHSSYMSMQFPLLFIYGQDGYSKDLKMVDPTRSSSDQK
ncbi:zinc finger, C6HC-type containing protein [Tanacetum coccineum]